VVSPVFSTFFSVRFLSAESLALFFNEQLVPGHALTHDAPLQRRGLFMPAKHGGGSTLPHHVKLNMRQAGNAYSGVGGTANGGNAQPSHGLLDLLDVASGSHISLLFYAVRHLDCSYLGNAGNGGHANSGDAMVLGVRQNAYSGAGGIANGGEVPVSHGAGLFHLIHVGSGPSLFCHFQPCTSLISGQEMPVTVVGPTLVTPWCSAHGRTPTLGQVGLPTVGSHSPLVVFCTRSTSALVG
jgi:hypothetical protein